MSRPNQVDRSRIEREAAEWVVRLHGDGLDAASRHALQAWTAQSAEHEASLARARRGWAMLGQLAGHGDSLLADSPSCRPSPACRFAPSRRALAGLAATVLLSAGLATWQLHRAEDLGPGEAYSTARGETRRIALADGSLITLAPASAIRVRYNAERRQVDLLAGEALFAPSPVGAKEARPFVVAAGNGQVRALGTRFLLAQRVGGVDVTVLEHRVEVSFSGQNSAAGAPASVVLSPQQQVRYGTSGLARPRPVDAERSAAWVSGQLVFDRMPLVDVAAVMDRYRTQPIVVAGAGLRARLVSGVFRTDALDDMLRTIAGETGARILLLPFPMWDRVVLY